MGKSTTPYGEETTVTLNGWERRQLVMWVEDAIGKLSQNAAALKEMMGGSLKLEAERQLEWTKDLHRKLLPDED